MPNVLKIVPKGNRARLYGDISKQHNSILEAEFVWQSLLDLSYVDKFYVGGYMRSGIMYSVAKRLEELGRKSKVELPELSPKQYDWNFVWQYRPLQEPAVETMLRERYGVLKAVAGVGKTVMFSAITARLGKRTAIITERTIPMEQAYRTLHEATDIDSIGKVGGSGKQVFGEVTVFTIQSLVNALKTTEDEYGNKIIHSEWIKPEFEEWFKDCKVFIVDECFPAGTLVDGRAIEKYRVGDYVNAYCHKSNTVVSSRIKAISKKKATNLVEVKFKNGRSQICTAEHPFYSTTRESYIPAMFLLDSDMVLDIMVESKNVVYPVSNANPKRTYEASKIQTEKDGSSLLFNRVRESLPSRGILTNYGGNESEVCLGSNEAEQSYALRRSEGESVNNSSCKGSCPEDSWGERNRSDSSSETPCIRFRVGYGNCSSNEEKKGGLSFLLQNRCRERNSKNCYRNRWIYSYDSQSSESGSTEARVSRELGVESVTFLQSNDKGEYGELCPGGFVYNLEVEHYHNYFVNGILVHNCHHVAADSYLKVIDTLKSVEYLIGVSATPWRDDDRHDYINAYLGPVQHEITYKQAIDHKLLCPVSIDIGKAKPKDYGYVSKKQDLADVRRELQSSFLSKDERVELERIQKQLERDTNTYAAKNQFEKVKRDYLWHNPQRNGMVRDYVNGAIDADLTVAVLVTNIEHGKEIKAKYLPEAVEVYGTTDKKIRAKILGDSKYRGDLYHRKINCVITTLMDEAVDIPTLDAVVLAGGGASSVKLLQRLRSLRTFDGMLETGYYKKERGYVFYIKDKADYLTTHSVKCVSLLKALAAEHKDNEVNQW